MLNNIVLMGRLTRDPELRSTRNGTPVATFSIAVERDFQPQDGSEKITDFIQCVAWKAGAEFVSKYFRKGSLIALEGELNSKKWEQDGVMHYGMEVTARHLYFTGERSQDRGQAQADDSVGFRPAAAPVNVAVDDRSPAQKLDDLGRYENVQFRDLQEADDGELPF